MRQLFLTVMVLLLAASAAGQEIFDAVRAGDLARVQALVGQDPAAARAVDGRSCTPLHFAVNDGRAEVAAFLLDSGADPEARDADGDTPLHWAACTDHLELVDLLLRRGASIDALNHQHLSPVFHAVTGLRYAQVERLAAAGADLEISNDYGRTPLIWTARERGDLQMARLLLRLGARVDAQDRSGLPAVELAAWRGFRTLVGILLDAGARTDLRPDSRQSLLNDAAGKGLDRLYEELVSDGLTFEIAPEVRANLLHRAAEGGSGPIVADLIARGWSVEARDMYGWTPLHHAAGRKRPAAVRALLAAGAAADTRSLSGHTPLALAVASGATEVADLLRAAGHRTERRDFPALRGPFLGQGEPPAVPGPFAVDLVAGCWGEHGSVSFAPDGRKAFWSAYIDLPDSGYASGTILTSRLVDGCWTPPAPAAFEAGEQDDVPFVAPDGERVFFMSRRPLTPGDHSGAEHIWVCRRRGDGWAEAQPLPACVNSMPQHWQFSVAANGNLYFNSRQSEAETQGVYVSRLVGDSYTAPEFLGFAGDTPYIAPDESYLVTSESYGSANVIRFRQEDGSWGQPHSVTEAYPGYGGMCPKFSPDGRAFFFISQRTGTNNNFWVDGGFLEELRARDRRR